MTDHRGEDATRRTFLAVERTYLAWWRTGVTALAVSLGAARVIPALANVSATWPYTALGVGYGVAGLGCMAYGGVRRKRVEAAVARGEWAPLPGPAATALTGMGVLLAVATILILLLDT